MDTILRTQLENRLRAAIEANDQKAYRIALLDVQVAQMQCQEKTAQRVKTLEQYIHDAEQRAQGAKWTAKAFTVIFAASGGAAGFAALLKFVQFISS